MSNKIVTVCGEIKPDDLGVTLPHEHLIVDTRGALKELKKEINRDTKRKPITLDIRGEVVYEPFTFIDNLSPLSIEESIEEAKKFKQAGGNTIVDLTTVGIGRDPEKLFKISTMTGLNIIMAAGYFGSGYFINEASENIKNKTELEIIKGIINEFEYGVGNTGIKPGIIGEIGIHNFDENHFEMKNLKASARAQKEIGCALNIHQPSWTRVGNRILNILEKERSDLSKVILSHCDCDSLLDIADYHNSLAKRGAYIEYDIFGAEFMSIEGKFFPSDGERIRAIKDQIERGNLERILISHDACHKIAFTKWGGFGWEHILKNIVPRLEHAGITKDQIKMIIAENPKRVLSF